MPLRKRANTRTEPLALLESLLRRNFCLRATGDPGRFDIVTITDQARPPRPIQRTKLENEANNPSSSAVFASLQLRRLRPYLSKRERDKESPTPTNFLDLCLAQAEKTRAVLVPSLAVKTSLSANFELTQRERTGQLSIQTRFSSTHTTLKSTHRL